MANRKKSEDRKLQDKVQVYLTKDEREIIDRMADEKDRSASYVGRDLLLSGLQFVEGNLPNVTLRMFPSAAPCGSFVEIEPSLKSFQINGELAELLGLLDDDLVVPVSGISMVEAGIDPHAVLVMRPLYGALPQHGDIVLAQAYCEDDSCKWTVKRWIDNGNGACLVNGKHEEISAPNNVIQVRPMARSVWAFTPQKRGV